MNGKYLSVLLPFCLLSQIKESSGFLENSLVDMAIHGSRVVVTSQSGISWVDDLRLQPLQWKSITGIQPFSDEEQLYRDDILLSDSEMIIPVTTSSNEISYLYRKFSEQTSSLHSFVPAGIGGEGAELHGYCGTVHAGKFYLPLYDAGILQVESGKPTAILIPDSNTIFPSGYEYTAVVSDSLKPVALSADDSSLTVLTGSLLMKFRFADSTWSKRLLPSGINWFGLTEADSGLILTGREDSEMGRVRHFKDDVTFTEIFSDHSECAILRMGKSTYYTASPEIGIVPYSVSTGMIDESINQFGRRIENSDGFGGSYEIRDMGYSVIGTDTLFAIATSAGFFYSTDEHADEQTKEPFVYVRRDRKISAGLAEIYAVPFIIRESSNALFEYSLGEDASVSIDILDYNLDFVCRIIDNEPRQSGVKTSSGHSTVRGKDFWDGSRSGHGGETVAPGVYYFRITTDRGERGFGKVIVAKN